MESYSGKVMELKARLQHSKAKYLEHLLTWHELQEMLVRWLFMLQFFSFSCRKYNGSR